MPDGKRDFAELRPSLHLSTARKGLDLATVELARTELELSALMERLTFINKYQAVMPQVSFTRTNRRVIMKMMSLSLFLVSSILVGCTTDRVVQTSAHIPRTESCKATTEAEIASLFDRWNQSLQTGDPHKVVANYAERSILLPTVSNKPRLTAVEKEDYFHHFLENQPSGKIDLRIVEIGCNTAVDAGLYTFTFAKTGATVSGRYSYTYRWNGSEWLITSHHSSAMPEKK